MRLAKFKYFIYSFWIVFVFTILVLCTSLLGIGWVLLNPTQPIYLKFLPLIYLCCLAYWGIPIWGKFLIRKWKINEHKIKTINKKY